MVGGGGAAEKLPEQPLCALWPKHMWIQVDPGGSRWIQVDPGGSWWIQVDPGGSRWILVDPGAAKGGTGATSKPYTPLFCTPIPSAHPRSASTLCLSSPAFPIPSLPSHKVPQHPPSGLPVLTCVPHTIIASPCNAPMLSMEAFTPGGSCSPCDREGGTLTEGGGGEYRPQVEEESLRGKCYPQTRPQIIPPMA